MNALETVVRYLLYMFAVYLLYGLAAFVLPGLWQALGW